MSTPEHHDLHHEFPEFKDTIHQLKMSNHHFTRLFDEYHKVNREVLKAFQWPTKPPRNSRNSASS